METLEQLKTRIEAAVPGSSVEIVLNANPDAKHSLLVDNTHALAVAKFLRQDPALRVDYASNVTAIDWLDQVTQELARLKKPA